MTERIAADADYWRPSARHGVRIPVAEVPVGTEAALMSKHADASVCYGQRGGPDHP
jgi:hypothetical protein